MHGFGGRAVRLVAAAAMTAALLMGAATGVELPAGAASTTGSGYWLAGADGGVYAFGSARHLGSMAGRPLARPVVTVVATATGNGYWLAASDGGMFAFGDAGFFGSMGGKPLNSPIVGMTSTPDSGGYWQVAADGGMFAFGNAAFSGSMGGKALNAPIVGMASGSANGAYWLVAGDGGMFAFGGAPFKGSMGGRPLNSPIVGMAATPSGNGYWLVARDGGIFAFGDAGFFGSMGGRPLNRPIVGMAASPTGGGYWLVASDGGMFAFGDAGYFGSTGGQALRAPVVGMAVRTGLPGPVQSNDPVVLAAGDIAGCDTSGDEATAAVLDSRDGIVLPLGDLVYPDGTLSAFQDCYEPTWGRHRGRTLPVPGNHEYHVAGAAGYFDYFGPAAGDRTKGYYSYNLGVWQVLALNSEDCKDADGCAQQAAWAAAQMAASNLPCKLAYWHRARFSSTQGEEPAVDPLWQAAANGGVDVVLAGHLHVYERFAPLAADGSVDSAGGMRQFINGLGGRSFHGAGSTARIGSEVRQNTAFGVTSLTLRPDGYSWEFVPVAGSSFTDAGSDTCKN